MGDKQEGSVKLYTEIKSPCTVLVISIWVDIVYCTHWLNKLNITLFYGFKIL